MKNLNIRVAVPSDRRLVMQLPDDVEPGEATVMIIQRRQQSRPGADFDFPTLHVKQWPADWGTLRREDTYGDDGR